LKCLWKSELKDAYAGLDNPFTRNIDPTLILDMPFSEGVGNIAHDRSLHGNHGTIDGATWVDGKVGKALSFDGIDDYVEVPHAAEQSTDHFTLMAWAYFDLVGANRRIISKGFTSGVYPWVEYDLNVQDAIPPRPKLEVSIDGIRYFVYGETGLFAGRWYHMAATYDGLVAKVYLNGVEDQSLNATGVRDHYETPIFIGKYGPLSGYEHPGDIDEVRIYNRALGPSEILRLYNEQK